MPSRPFTGTAVGLAATATVAVAGLAAVRVRDPHVPGSWGLCPVALLTGFACPGCGALRAGHALSGGDVLGALSSNALAVGLLVLGVAVWVTVLVALVRGRDLDLSRHVTGRRALVLAAVVAAFTVLRNTTAGGWLAP